MATIKGTTGADNLNAGNATSPVSIIAGLGNDTLAGSAYDDLLDAGDGNDSLYGGLGNDTMTGGAGSDRFFVNAGTDTVTDLGAGDALIVSAGAVANATVTSAFQATAGTSNAGTANLYSQGVTVNLGVAAGPNGYRVENISSTGASFIGSTKSDTLIGGAGADSLKGGAGNDVLTGGGGNDWFYIDSGTDIVTDMSGGDAINVTAGAVANVTVTGALSATNATNNGTVNMSTAGFNVNLGGVTAGVGGFSITNTSPSVAVVFTGGALKDSIYGGDANDTIDGGRGSDLIYAGAGNDVVLGGYGNDTIYTGAGADTVRAGDGADVVTAEDGANLIYGDTGADTINAGAGNDTVDGGSEDDRIFGGEGDDALTGGVGHDSLDGGAGNDTLTGSAGADTLTGGAGSDTFVYTVATDSNTYFGDRVTDFNGVRDAGVTSAAVDKIDLSAILGATDLTWGGENTPTPNGVWFVRDAAAGKTYIYADTDGAATTTPELLATLDGLHQLSNADFLGVTNTAPVAVNDSNGSDELIEASDLVAGDASAVGSVLTNDSDDAGNVGLSVTAVKFGSTSYAPGATIETTYGSIVVQANGSYSYTLNNSKAATDALAQDEVVTETLTYTVTDEAGKTAKADLVISITGSNESPVVATADVTGAVSELVTPSGDLSDTGTIGFTDVDLSDTHSIDPTIVASAGALGALTASVNTDASAGLGGVITWNYSVAASAVEYLAKDETKVETFTITLDDGHGGTVDRTIEVTIAGTNDAPVVATADVSGAVTELVTPAGNLTDTGTIGFSDVDLIDTHSISSTITASADALGALTASVSTDTTAGVGGVVTWNYSVAASAVEYLAKDETKVETFTIKLDDGHGGTVDRAISVTITGTNDDPVIVTKGPVVAITAMAETPPYPDWSHFMKYGEIDFIDVDLADTHSVSDFVGTDGPVLGGYIHSVLTKDSTGLGVGGKVSWIYKVDAYSFGGLAEGEQAVYGSGISLYDSNGGDSSVLFEFIATGKNGLPVVTSVDGPAFLTEDAANTDLRAIGEVLFFDEDGRDTVTVTNAYNANAWWSSGWLTAGQIAALTAGFSNDQDSWEYSVSNAAVQFLARGESVSFSYTLTPVDDYGTGNGKSVEVSITGTNDIPVVGVEDVTGALTELVTAAGKLSDTGTIGFTDVDLSDTHSIDPTIAASAGALGALTASVSTDTSEGLGGEITWNYSVAAAAVEYLAKDETKVETFTVKLDDGHGGTVDRTIEVTITGTNDAPVISGTADNAADAVKEDVDAFATGTLTSADIDHDATATWSIQGNATGTYGSLALDGNTGKWTYTLNDSDTDTNALKGLEHVTDSFTVRVTDDKGGYDEQTVVVTIEGTNDAPVGGPESLPNGTEDTVFYVTLAQLLAGFTDAEGDTLSIASNAGEYVVTSADATVTYDSENNRFVVKPNPDVNGSIVIGYQVTDGTDVTDWAVTVNLTAVNDVPVLSGTQASTLSGTEDTTLVIAAAALLEGFGDVDGDTLQVANLVASTGAVVDNLDGTFTLTPNLNANGAGTLTYSVIDGQGGVLANQTLGYNLAAVNDAPTVGALTLGATVSFTTADVDGDTLSAGAGSPATVVSGANTLTPAEQATLKSGIVSVTDGQATTSIVNYTAGTIAADTVSFAGSTLQSAMFGFGGNDVLTGGDAANWMDGGVGNDALTGGAVGDTLIGGDGTDSLVGGGGADSLDGGLLADTLTGGAGDDTMNGGSGNDTFNVDAGNDSVSDLATGDILVVTAGATATVTTGGAFVATAATTNSGTAGITSNGYTVTLTSAGGTNGYSVTNSSSTAVTFTGSGFADSLVGGGGADTLNGGVGSDTVYGGAGQDSLTGGAGSDTFHFAQADVASYDVISDFVSVDDTFTFTGFSLANQAGAGAVNSVVTLANNAIGAGGTSIAGADVVVLNLAGGNRDSYDTATEVDTALAAQSGTFDGGVFVLAYGDNVAGNQVTLYYDADANTAGGVSVVAVLTNYTATSTAGAPTTAADYMLG
jgi:VCBS repeat-containing protein